MTRPLFRHPLIPGVALLAVLMLGAVWPGAARAQTTCPQGEIANPATGRCEKAPSVEPSGHKGALSPPDNPPPVQNPLSVDRTRGLTSPAAANAGSCPNTTSYAYDPRTGRCVSLPPCPNDGIWNPDKNQCVPRPPGGVLECLDGYEFDTTKDACIAPNCGSLVFSPQQGKCVPPRPVICAPGLKFDFQKNQCVAEAYDILQFVIGTGGDDLRSSSSAWAIWTNPAGTVVFCTLHTSADGWSENSTHTVVCDLGASPMTLAQLRSAKFSIGYNDGINVDSGVNLDTADNWNLQSVAINAMNQSEPPVCVFAASGDPLHRFQEVPNVQSFSDPSLGVWGAASDGIIVTDYPGGCR